MRLIGTLYNVDQARLLCSNLTAAGIENELEVKKGSDWGSESYGTFFCRIWIIDEDQIEEAQKKFSSFQNDPTNFIHSISNLNIEPAEPEERDEKSLEDFITDFEPGDKTSSAAIKRKNGRQPPLKGSMTINFILACVLLFFVGVATKTSTTAVSNGEEVNLDVSPIKEKLLYDNPHAFEILQNLINTYGLEKLSDLEALPPEGQALWQQYLTTPYWKGFYPEIVNHFRKGDAPQKYVQGPLFEKIRQGEMWRLFSPIFLHADIFHLIFNMLWLAVLGIQLERNLGAKKYLLFVLLTAIFSNTMQYLMSGPNFLGFSGVLCAMLAFIWIRQKRTPWEGYQLQRSTFVMITIFILAMFSFQSLAFLLQILGYSSFPLGIANTAHLSGAAIGALLGFMPFFKSVKA